MGKMEFRFKPAELRYHSTGDDRMIVSGYVNLTEQFSNILDTGQPGVGFVEKIEQGAFSRALQRSVDDIDFLAEHDTRLILSSTRNDSLSLVEDEKGLYMSAIISPTTWGRDYYTLIKDGILQNFSFGFVALDDAWEERDDGLMERTIKELDLFEVSVVKNPAYPQSNIQARNIDAVTGLDLEKRMKEERMMSDKNKDLEKREEQIGDEGETQDEEEMLVSLERTVLALDLKIEKLYKMVEEALSEIIRKDDEEDDEEDESTETDEEVVDEEKAPQDEEVDEERDIKDEKEEEKPEKDVKEDDENEEKRSEKEENEEILGDVIADLQARIKNLKE